MSNLTSQTISSTVTADEIPAGSRSNRVRSGTSSNGSVFKLPEDFNNGRPRQQDTILEAVSKEEARTGHKEEVEKENIRQTNVRQVIQKQKAELEQIKTAKINASKAEHQAGQSSSDISGRSRSDVHRAGDENFTNREKSAETKLSKLDNLLAKDVKNDTLDSKGIDSKVLNNPSLVLGTTHAIHNTIMSPLAVELPLVNQSLSAQGGDFIQPLFDKNTDSFQNNRFGSQSQRENKQNAEQNNKHDLESKEKDYLNSVQRANQDTPVTQASPSATTVEVSPLFKIESSTSSQASTSAVQVEVVTGIMQQIEQLRQSGKSSMQITLVLPEGQELKLHLRTSKDQVQIKMESADQEIYDAVYSGWADLTEQAARKGIRLDVPSFMRNDTVGNLDSNILQASA